MVKNLSEVPGLEDFIISAVKEAYPDDPDAELFAKGLVSKLREKFIVTPKIVAIEGFDMKCNVCQMRYNTLYKFEHEPDDIAICGQCFVEVIMSDYMSNPNPTKERKKKEKVIMNIWR